MFLGLVFSNSKRFKQAESWGYAAQRLHASWPSGCNHGPAAAITAQRLHASRCVNSTSLAVLHAVAASPSLVRRQVAASPSPHETSGGADKRPKGCLMSFAKLHIT